MQLISAVRAAAESDPGLHREVNEDRFHVDLARGLYIVIDGVGGQAAGGKAADTAVTMLRKRLERETGPKAERIREAITVANNEIYRLASLRPEWSGMACVLTVVLVEDGRALIGHVGDTRLYKLRESQIEKVTRDHSPVGEREDADEISELDAMRHPRRNEVYRDVGSEAHDAADSEFVDLQEISFEADAALLLCSDGLTDLVPSASLNQIVTRFAGDPRKVVHALIDAANDAGGKDNVTVVYVEGDQFAASQTRARPLLKGPNDIAERSWRVDSGDSRSGKPVPPSGVSRVKRVVRVAILALLALVIGAALARMRIPWSIPDFAPAARSSLTTGRIIVVQPTESIAAALGAAEPGSQVIVEPGEYREQLSLRDGVRVVSRIPRGATLRLPSTASEGEPAVVAADLSSAEFRGFRIVGDAATPLGTGLLVRNASLTVIDVEITGAANIAIDLAQGQGSALLGSDIHDNPGAAIAIRSGSSPRIAHNAFRRNGMSERAPTLVIENGAQPQFVANMFQGITPDAVAALQDRNLATAFMQDNWFVGVHEPKPATPAVPRSKAR
jgi:serine/threonine protein phosphatase PrpC